MVDLPLTPRWNRYRGAKPNLKRRAVEENRIAQRVCDHVNRLIANDPEEIQQYIFGYVAIDLGLPVELVRRAIPGGGFNGITLRVRNEDRPLFARFKDPS